MAKKSGVNISRIVVLRMIIFSFIAFVLFTGYVDAVEYLTTSPLFNVRQVMVDRSIRFIDTRSLKDLMGVNIFKVNLNNIDHQITSRYPYIAQLRVVRQLPDRIMILARKRDPLLQVYYRKKYLLFDTEGVALYYTLQPANLPQVYGVPMNNKGEPALNTVVDILNMFGQSPYLRKWRIHAVQAGNLAKIDLSVGENMHVILDQDDTQNKIDLLQMLIASNKVNLNTVKYIDLRFQEPIIADTITDSKTNKNKR